MAWSNSSRRAAAKRAVIARDGLHCYICGRELEEREVTLDHVIPRSVVKKHGLPIDDFDLDNLRVCCRRDNFRKGARLLKPKAPRPPETAPGW